MSYPSMLALAVIAALIAACASTEPDESALLSMTIDGVQPEAQWVSGVLRNDSDTDFFHSQCFAELQQKQGGEWIRSEPDVSCPLPLISLKPGSRVEFRVGPRQGSTECEYRIVATVRASFGSEGAGETVMVASEPFCFR